MSTTFDPHWCSWNPCWCGRSFTAISIGPISTTAVAPYMTDHRAGITRLSFGFVGP